MPQQEKQKHIESISYMYYRWYYNIAITAKNKSGLSDIYHGFSDVIQKKTEFKLPYIVFSVSGGMFLLHTLLSLRHKINSKSN